MSKKIKINAQAGYVSSSTGNICIATFKPKGKEQNTLLKPREVRREGGKNQHPTAEWLFTLQHKSHLSSNLCDFACECVCEPEQNNWTSKCSFKNNTTLVRSLLLEVAVKKGQQKKNKNKRDKEAKTDRVGGQTNRVTDRQFKGGKWKGVMHTATCLVAI